MVDVSGKAVTRRIAVARSLLHLPPAVSALFLASEPSTSPPSSPSSPRSPPSPSPDLHLAKGPVFATAIIAGTMAVKQTSSLIPLCHPLPLEHIALRIRHHPPAAVQQQLQPPAAGGVPEGWGVLSIDCEVRCSGKTGVEMEALVGASVAALTCYDMLKAVSHAMVLSDTRLLSKEGGKSKLVHAPDTQQQQQQQQRGGAGVGTV